MSRFKKHIVKHSYKYIGGLVVVGAIGIKHMMDKNYDSVFKDMIKMDKSEEQ